MLSCSAPLRDIIQAPLFKPVGAGLPVNRLKLKRPGSVIRVRQGPAVTDRESTRLNYSNADISTLSLHDALPIYPGSVVQAGGGRFAGEQVEAEEARLRDQGAAGAGVDRSGEHTSELQ